jgi:hypothetical protein
MAPYCYGGKRGTLEEGFLKNLKHKVFSYKRKRSAILTMTCKALDKINNKKITS